MLKKLCLLLIILISFTISACDIQELISEDDKKKDDESKQNGDGDTSNLDPGAASEMAENTVKGTGFVFAVAAPLGEGLNSINGLGENPSEEDTKAALEDAIYGNSIVTDKNCVKLTWTKEVDESTGYLKTLSGEAILTDCQAKMAQMTLNGTLKVDAVLAPNPITVKAEFKDFKVDNFLFDGKSSVVLTKKESETDKELTVDVTADVKFGQDKAENELTYKEFKLVITKDGITVDAKGSVKMVSADLDGDFSIKGLQWLKGDCLPSAGAGCFTTQLKFIGIKVDGVVNMNFNQDTPTTFKAKRSVCKVSCPDDCKEVCSEKCQEKCTTSLCSELEVDMAKMCQGKKE